MADIERRIHLLHPERQLDKAERMFRHVAYPARVTANIFEIIKKDHNIPLDQLAASSGADYYSKWYPDLGLLVNRVWNTRQSVGEFLYDINMWSSKHKKKPQEAIFESLSNGKKPTGEVQLLKEESDLAVVLEMSPDDYHAVNNNKRSIGCYMKKQNFMIDERNYVFIPVIAIKTSSHSNNILEHERAHAWHHQFVDSVISNKEWWRKPERVYENMERLKTKWNKNPNEAIKSAIRKRTLEGVYLLARSEIISMLISGDDMEYLFERKGSYDYLQHLENTTDLYNNMWSEYESTVRRELRTVENLWNIYTQSGWNRRKELIPWMLMRMPLDSWSNKLTEIGVIEEAITLQQSEIRLNKLQEESKSLWFQLNAFVSGKGSAVEQHRKAKQQLLDQSSDILLTRFFEQVHRFLPS